MEAQGAKSGGWCDIVIETLPPSLDVIEPGEKDDQNPTVVANVIDEASDPDDVIITQEEMHGTMSEMLTELSDSPIHLGDVKVKPVVSYEGKVMYKSTLASQLVGNPTLGKDRLTRVKQNFYFNNLVDKPKDREGVPTKFMGIGMDSGVFFIAEPQLVKLTRSQTVLQALT